MVVTTELLTIADLAALPDDGSQYELVRGRLEKMPPPKYRHGATLRKVCVALSLFVEHHQLGEVICGDTGYVLARDPDTVAARVPQGIARDRYSELPPDLAVEVLSPDDRPGAVAEKVYDYLQSGVRAVWLIDPQAAEIRVFSLDEPVRIYRDNEELGGGAVLPGFRCTVRDLIG